MGTQTDILVDKDMLVDIISVIIYFYKSKICIICIFMLFSNGRSFGKINYQNVNCVSLSNLL